MPIRACTEEMESKGSLPVFVTDIYGPIESALARATWTKTSDREIVDGERCA